MSSDRTITAPPLLDTTGPLLTTGNQEPLPRPTQPPKAPAPPSAIAPWPQWLQWPRPKSLSGLMLLGLAFIAVPLLWAVIGADFQMQTLTMTGQTLVKQGATAAQASQELSNEINSLERTVKLLQALSAGHGADEAHKSDELQAYHSYTDKVNAARQQLEALASAPVKHTLIDLAEVQQSIDQLVPTMTGTGSHQDEISRDFSKMDSLVTRLDKQTHDQINEELRILKTQADHARRLLILESVGLLPLMLLSIFGLTVVVGRPLKHLDRAISDLGEKKNLSKPIEVPGPHDLERLGKKLEWLRVRMLELDNERSRFMRHMSHELKTPLAAITDGTELLMDGTVGTLDPAQQEVMEILREKSKSLQEMIDNLLSFTAWQTSRVGLVPGEFQLRSIVKQVIENHRIMILRQRLRLDLAVDEITLVADRSKFRLIIENLVSNALKYSPKGSTIHIKGRQEGSQLVLDVADHGPGIALDERDQIFEAFFTGRAAKARKSSLKGTGIGLSVVLEFVSAHQGKIEIIDGEYPGAHFRVTMPLQLECDDVPGSEKAHAD